MVTICYTLSSKSIRRRLFSEYCKCSKFFWAKNMTNICLLLISIWRKQKPNLSEFLSNYHAKILDVLILLFKIVPVFFRILQLSRVD